MSYMADKDHIAITSRDASTTRCKFCTGMSSALPPSITFGESSDTYRRIASGLGNMPGKVPIGSARYSVRQLVWSGRAHQAP